MKRIPVCEPCLAGNEEKYVKDAIETALNEITTRTRGRFVDKNNQLFQSFYLEKEDFEYVPDAESADAVEESG